ncbi:MAG TPA: PAS domain-containing protein, partial [Sphingomicrobium sp.]|nr:PAS domain-containing protein [Sphingomicrobium sp.]
MLYQELPRIDSTPLDGWARWLVPALIAAAAISATLVLLFLGYPLVWTIPVLVIAGGAAILLLPRSSAQKVAEPLIGGPDYSLVGSALSLSRDAVALTNGEGSLLVVNAAYRERFGTTRPLDLAGDDEARDGLKLAQSMAWRDGAGCVAGIVTSAGTSPVEVERVGARNDLLLWHFPQGPLPDPLAIAVRRIEGPIGERLSSAGVASAVVDDKGAILAANRLFAERAIGPDQTLRNARFADLVEVEENEQMRLLAEGDGAQPLRAVHVPADSTGEGGAGTFLLFGSGSDGAVAQSSNLQALLDVMPIGLALVDRDGRFLTMNGAFRQAAGIKGSAMPVYPGDLVVKEDKAAVADAVRRNARGPAMSGDLAVRLTHQATEPVALTIAGLRGLGDAAVLLLLKD